MTAEQRRLAGGARRALRILSCGEAIGAIAGRAGKDHGKLVVGVPDQVRIAHREIKVLSSVIALFGMRRTLDFAIPQCHRSGSAFFRTRFVRHDSHKQSGRDEARSHSNRTSSSLADPPRPEICPGSASAQPNLGA